MIDILKINKTFFFDIEVVSEYPDVKTFKALQPAYYKHWEKIVSKYSEAAIIKWTEDDENAAYFKYAPLYPEFSKIISIAYGTTKWQETTQDFSITIRSLASETEDNLLKNFSIVLAAAIAANPEEVLCGHNIIEYDIPFLIKRMIKNKIKIPLILRKTLDAKPWELNILDTIKFWKFGGQRFAALSLITDFLGLDSSKNEMDGSMVNGIYWNSIDKNVDLKKIKDYNEKDVKATIDLVLLLQTY